jgi:hypothetical protein
MTLISGDAMSIGNEFMNFEDTKLNSSFDIRIF